MFVFCVLVSSAMGLSVFGEPQEVKLPSRNAKPKKILTAAESNVMAKLISGSTRGLSEKYISEYRQSAANAFTSTGMILAIAKGEAGQCNAGFKSQGIRNTGIVPWKNVTATVKAEISHFQADPPGGYISLYLVMYKDGNETEIDVYKRISGEGSISITSPPFTIETSGDWHALVFLHCYSRNSNYLSSVAGTIREINFDFGK